MANHLSADRILSIHSLLVEIFASLDDPVSPPGVRDLNLVHSAAARPQTSLGSIEKYPSVIAKAAALFHSLVTNHAFHNGNKRTALLSMVTFLAENHRRLTVSDDDIFEFVTSVAQGFVPGRQPPNGADDFLGQITQWIEDHSVHLQANARSMKTGEFISHATQAGAKCKISGNQWVVIGKNLKSIRINRNAKAIPGMAVRVYLGKLGMSESQSGVKFEEFQAGLNPEQAFVQSLLAVLRRLAYA
jgi:death-on-curing protein